jgi:hypothetical protein
MLAKPDSIMYSEEVCMYQQPIDYEFNHSEGHCKSSGRNLRPLVSVVTDKRTCQWVDLLKSYTDKILNNVGTCPKLFSFLRSANFKAPLHRESIVLSSKILKFD